MMIDNNKGTLADKYADIYVKIPFNDVNGETIATKMFTVFNDISKQDIIKACDIFNFEFSCTAWKYGCFEVTT